jgi:hypothetical protein
VGQFPFGSTPVGVVDAQGVVGSLAESGIRKTRNGESFGKYAQTALTDDVNYRVLRTRENRKITS